MPAHGHLRAYCDLLNESIRDAASGLQAQSSTSLIGASVWTASEKDTLTQQLPLKGRGDLLRLSQAVGKSESEIQSYLALLSKNSEDSALSDVPAAQEISYIEPDLEDIADSLASRVFEHEIQGAKDEYGPDQPWLIDPAVAEAIEEYHAAEEEAKGETEDDVKARHNTLTAPDDGQYNKMTSLLKPESFLNLSRTLFMNHSTNPDLNWSTCPLISDEIEEPSILHSAFEDFYNLAVSRTRRIVQASIFQAISRLRASDSSRPDWNPAAIVRDADVHAALDMLNAKPNRNEYWAKAARRCQVKVFSDSKKYADGRPGTKTGHELTFDEVEAELADTESTNKNSGEVDNEVSAGDVDDFLEDSDNFTAGSEAESDEILLDETEEDTESKSRSRSRSRKRKRASSPTSFIRMENRYLELLDHNASLAESNRICDLLGLDSKRALKMRRVQERELPAHPGATPDAEKRISDWRVRLDYEAEWEHPLGIVETDEFDEMEARGIAGRRRRAALLRGVRQRLSSENDLAGRPQRVARPGNIPVDGDSAEELSTDASDAEVASGTQDDSEDDEF